MPHIHMLQIIETLRSVTNGHYSDIPNFLNKYFARSTWTIFTFFSLNAILELEKLPHGYQYSLLPELARTIWNNMEFSLEDVKVLEIVHMFC